MYFIISFYETFLSRLCEERRLLTAVWKVRGTRKPGVCSLKKEMSTPVLLCIYGETAHTRVGTSTVDIPPPEHSSSRTSISPHIKRNPSNPSAEGTRAPRT
jgi:hypothetical protein